MSREDADRFIEALARDPSAAEQLARAGQPDLLMQRAVAMGHERGLSFTAAELAARMQDRTQAPRELPDQELGDVSGGLTDIGQIVNSVLKAVLPVALDPR